MRGGERGRGLGAAVAGEGRGVAAGESGFPEAGKRRRRGLGSNFHLHRL